MKQKTVTLREGMCVSLFRTGMPGVCNEFNVTQIFSPFPEEPKTIRVNMECKPTGERMRLEVHSDNPD
jgi:hypothetical protein